MPNLNNLNRVAEPPKIGSNWVPAQISKHKIQFQVEPTMIEPPLKFETCLKFFNSASKLLVLCRHLTKNYEQ